MSDSDSSSSSGFPEEPPAAEPIVCFAPDEEDQVAPAGPEISDEDLRVDPLMDAFLWLEKHLESSDREAHERILNFSETFIRTQIHRNNPETLGQIRGIAEDIRLHLSAYHRELCAKHDEGWVIREFAERIVESIANRVISELKKMKGDNLHSGGDSPLKNTWEEICVQIQGEHSFFWGAYQDTVTSIVAKYVEDLPPHEQHAIWFQTDDYQDWLSEEVEEREIEPPVTDMEVLGFIEGVVYSKAADFSNKNIEKWNELCRSED